MSTQRMFSDLGTCPVLLSSTAVQCTSSLYHVRKLIMYDQTVPFQEETKTKYSSLNQPVCTHSLNQPETPKVYIFMFL